MRRRELMLGGLAGLAWSATPLAQPAPRKIVGYLGTVAGGAPAAHLAAAFRQGLAEEGFVEGGNVTIDQRMADNRPDNLPELATELLRNGASVIAALGGPLPALAAKKATSTIPVVFLTGSDPVAQGLVASLNRPGGNLTGVSFLNSELTPKRMGLLREILPRTLAIAVLVNPLNPASALQHGEIEKAARTLGLTPHVIEAATATRIAIAFDRAVAAGLRTLIVTGDPFFTSRRHEIVALAARHALAVSYPAREFTEIGGLMSYGSSVAAAYRLAGVYVGRILNGAHPRDLPVQQPTRFELVLNLKTAKALGLEFPATLLAIADEVIE